MDGYHPSFFAHKSANKACDKEVAMNNIDERADMPERKALVQRGVYSIKIAELILRISIEIQSA